MMKERLKTDWVLVRSPGHWMHVGRVEHRDAVEIRLIDASNILRWRDGKGIAGLLEGPGENRLAQAIGTVVIIMGPGVVVYEDCAPWL